MPTLLFRLLFEAQKTRLEPELRDVAHERASSAPETLRRTIAMRSALSERGKDLFPHPCGIDDHLSSETIHVVA